MKIALVHELLTMKGGAERVLQIAADMFPDAPIYTLLYNEKALGKWFPKERIRTSSLQKWAKRLHSFNHHLYLPFFPKAIHNWDFSDYDVVLSFSSAFVHGIITNNAPKHICYVHTPARYLWDRTHDVLSQAGKGPLGPIRRRYLERTFHKLRIWDSEAADRPDKLIAASKAVQRRIELYWRRKSEVIYPPVDDFWMDHDFRSGAIEHSDYYLIVSNLVRYKRIDLAIEACEKAGKHLKIVGEGPDMSRLKKLAGPHTEFYGFRENEELGDIFTKARATIFPGDEDFGLVPLESMACGTPVIAYKGGGALETITEETGAFFDEPNADSLLRVLENFEQNNYSKEDCKSQARQFSNERFKTQIQQAIYGL